MSAFTQPYKGLKANHTLKDPGDAGTIRPNKSPCTCQIKTAAAETRTVADPTKVGKELTLTMVEDGGDCTITFSSAYDQAGSTTFTLNDAVDTAYFVSARDDGDESGTAAYAWRLMGTDGAAGPTQQFAAIDLNGTADGLILDADGDTTISAPTDDQIDIEIAGADDFTFTANAFNVLSGSSVVVAGNIDFNGVADSLILDADADTTISAPTDDQIDIEIAGADDFTFTANAFNVLSGSSITLADSAPTTYGTGGDFGLDWDGTWLEAITIGAQAIWSGSPSKADPSFDSIAHEWKEDFEQDLVDWTATADTTGTAVTGDNLHGVLLITNAATTDNDGTQAAFDNEVLQLVSGKEFWFETRVRCAAGDATNLDFFVGFAETEDLTGVADNMPANGIGFHKDDDDTNIDASSSDGGTNLQTAAVATLVDNTWVRLGMHFDGGATGSGTLTPYVDGVAGTAITSVTYATMTQLAPIAMVRNGDGTTTQTLEVDYFKVVQLR